jgi:3-methyladenine DNA glycosylase AlkD
MKDPKEKHQEITEFCLSHADEAIITKYARYFKEGYEGYGIDDKLFKDQKNIWLEAWKDEMSLSHYLNLGDLLVSTGKFEEAAFATHFVAAYKDEFTKETMERIGLWLEKGIQNWANTDVLCMLVLSAFLFQEITVPSDFIHWTASSSKWKRRAVPVTFVELIKKEYQPEPVFEVINLLMEDPEEDVQKGLGTLLREIWKRQPEAAEAFLLKWKDTCPRKIIQVATEKMNKDHKAQFKKIKQ